MFPLEAVTAQSSVHTDTANSMVKQRPFPRELRSANNKIMQFTQAKKIRSTLDYLKKLERYIAENQVGDGVFLEKNTGESYKAIQRERIAKFGEAVMLALKKDRTDIITLLAEETAQDGFRRVGRETLARWAKQTCPLDALYYATALRSIDSELSQKRLAAAIFKNYLIAGRDKFVNAPA